MLSREQNLLKELDIRILILSRGRSSTINTHRILPEFIEVLVPQSEFELYDKVVDNPVLTIPDEYKGLGAVRNWVLNNFKENIVIMIDDDVSTVYCLTEAFSRKITDKEELLQVLINAAVMAEDMGVHVFGFSQTDIRKYSATDPFTLCSWVGCCIGIIGRKYMFRKDKFKVDIDYCLQNILVERIIFMDNRYYFAQKRDSNVGGNSAYRSREEFDKSVDTLKAKWGKCLVVKQGGHKSNMSIKMNVKRKQAVDYE